MKGPNRWFSTFLFRAIIAVICATVVGASFRVARGEARPAEPYVGKNLTLTPVITGLTEPTFIAWSPDGTQRAFVLERGGLLRLADSGGHLNQAPLLDLSSQVSTSNEQGLLGLAFDPGFPNNGRFYVDYTALDWSIHVVRYSFSTEHPDYVDPATATAILTIPKQTKYHQAGMLAFGSDGDLYIAVGDDEQSERAQDLGVLIGKILRLDVASAEPYAIPPSNPFAGTDARGEVWDYGLRNPWRFSFDRSTGDLWIGDVHHVDEGSGGENNWESVDFQLAGQGGLNFGFPAHMFRCPDVANCQPTGVTAPVTQYSHQMTCSITGGYVYRGTAISTLTGAYVFGDYCTGGVFALRDSSPQPWSKQLELGFQPIKISSFGEDPSGELYVVDIQGGVIYRITDASLP